MALPADHPSSRRASRCGSVLALLRESGRVIEEDEVADVLLNMLGVLVFGLLFLHPELD